MANELTAPAKVNLTLHVTGQRDDGYHLLDSLVVRVDIADHLTVAPDDRLSLRVTGPFAQGVPVDDRNLVMQAARLLDPHRGARITLDKHLPHAAGIGGGSADAAAALRALSELWGLPLPDAIASLGADVPVCLSHGPQRMQGIGDRLTPVPGLPDMALLLVNPGVATPTAQVFGALDRKDNPPMPVDWPAFSSLGSFVGWLSDQRNDLQSPARRVVPVIDTVLAELDGAARLARMSGSGATCFGIFDGPEPAHTCARHLHARHPDWWCAVGAVLPVS